MHEAGPLLLCPERGGKSKEMTQAKLFLLMTLCIVSCRCYDHVSEITQRSTILASLIRLPAVLVLKTLKKLSELLFSSTFMQCKLLMPIGMPFSFLRLVHQTNELKFTWVLSSVLESLFSPRISSYLWSKV